VGWFFRLPNRSPTVRKKDLESARNRGLVSLATAVVNLATVVATIYNYKTKVSGKPETTQEKNNHAVATLLN
jgi:cell division protein FtsN